MLAAVCADFDAAAFERQALAGYEALELMPRARHIAAAMHAHLPADYPGAIAAILASLGPPLDDEPNPGLGSFLYLPHVFYVAEHGLGHFELSMQAQHALTQRFTAEFSIRPYLERHREATLARLRQWAADPSVHVRRLVSEGTRPRLPWAPRLRDFQRDPTPVLALLELLRDDPALYVRRSVANNLNDIGKDHPDILAATASRWLRDAPPERQWLVRHALRSAIKRGEPGALAALGYGDAAALSLGQASCTPARPRLGGSVVIAFTVTNASRRRQRAIVDFRIHFVKAGGKASAKTFKLKAVDLAPGDSTTLRKTVSLADLTTRRHYPGRHAVEAQINGVLTPLCHFDLLP
jgi:3-methyladenine DNA glycosylase AlkC